MRKQKHSIESKTKNKTSKEDFKFTKVPPQNNN